MMARAAHSSFALLMALPACVYDFDSVPYTTNKDLRPGFIIVALCIILQISIDLCGFHTHLPLVVGRGYPLRTRLIRLTVSLAVPHLAPPHLIATWAAAGSSRASSGNHFYTAEEAPRPVRVDFTAPQHLPSCSACREDLHQTPKWSVSWKTMRKS